MLNFLNVYVKGSILKQRLNDEGRIQITGPKSDA